jgi:branched-subunit amino acid transport protein
LKNYETLDLLIVFFIIGSFTFLFRAIFLFNLPELFKNSELIRKGLESVPSSLLVVLVIPYAFFVETQLHLIRPEVFAIILTIPIIWITKKPGLSLIIAILVLIITNFLLGFL